MIGGFQTIGKIPELKRRILATFALLAVYRVGAHVPTPGINSEALQAFFSQAQGTLGLAKKRLQCLTIDPRCRHMSTDSIHRQQSKGRQDAAL